MNALNKFKSNINSFVSNLPFLYPLTSDVFWVYRSGTMIENRIKTPDFALMSSLLSVSKVHKLFWNFFNAPLEKDLCILRIIPENCVKISNIFLPAYKYSFKVSNKDKEQHPWKLMSRPFWIWTGICLVVAVSLISTQRKVFIY